MEASESAGFQAGILGVLSEGWRHRILLLPWLGNILSFRSEAGRTMSGRTAHFFVGAGRSALVPAVGRGVSA